MLNIFKDFLPDDRSEQEEKLFSIEKGRVLRIKSSGQMSPPGHWYEQMEDEWAVVLSGRGELEWTDGSRRMLESGDSIFLEKGNKHRVSYTSLEPPCIWLAIYGQIKMEDRND